MAERVCCSYQNVLSIQNRVCCLYRVSTTKQVDHDDQNQADIPVQRNGKPHSDLFAGTLTHIPTFISAPQRLEPEAYSLVRDYDHCKRISSRFQVLFLRKKKPQSLLPQGFARKPA